MEVSGPRGDRICQEALSELKVAVKAAGEHKQKVTVHVALDGLRLRDERTGVSAIIATNSHIGHWPLAFSFVSLLANLY